MQIKIYQINNERDKKNLLFQDKKRMEEMQGENGVNAAIYDEVFTGDVACEDLEEVFELFNSNIPPLHKGRSLSVSDVVVKYDGAYFCDSVGFEKINFDESQTQRKGNLIDVVFVEPNKPPIKAQIENSLEGMQRAVGGYIQPLYQKDGTVLICNEEGKLDSLPANRRVGYDVIMGNFFIAGDDGAEFRSLTEKEQEKYMQRFEEVEDYSTWQGIAMNQ